MFSVFVRSFWMLVTVFLVLNCKRRKTAALALFRLHWRIVNDDQYILCSSAIPCVMAFFPCSAFRNRNATGSKIASAHPVQSQTLMHPFRIENVWMDCEWFACGMPLPVWSIVLFDAPNINFSKESWVLSLWPPFALVFIIFTCMTTSRSNLIAIGTSWQCKVS